MGFKVAKQPIPVKLTGIPIQTASSVLPIPISYGLSRGAGNLLDYVDFTAKAVKAGKGGPTVGYDYHATVLIGVAEGEIKGLDKAWDTNGVITSYSKLGFTLFLGTMPQAPWGYMVGKHPDHADGYPGVAYLAHSNLDLGESGTLPNYTWEIQGELFDSQNGGVGDADPALMVQDYLINADHGVAPLQAANFLDLGALLSGPDAGGAGDSAFQTWCRASGLGFSVTLATQEQAAAALKRWTDLSITAAVWTGYSLKLVPYADTAVTGHGVTFLPPTATVFAMHEDDYVQDGDKDPVVGAGTDPLSTPNCVSFNVRDRANAYNPTPVDWWDDNAINLYGVVTGPSPNADEICDVTMGKAMVALYGQRLAFVRNTYQWTTGPRWDALEPMDCGTIDDPRLGMAIPVRLIEIDEDDKDQLAMTAEWFPGTLGSVPTAGGAAIAAPATIFTPVDGQADAGPVNPPTLLEPPSTLLMALYGSAAARVLAAVSGGDGTTADSNWGGALVWVSTDDATYIPAVDASGTQAKITAPARMGVSTAPLGAYGGANPDAVDTLSVDLTMSAGALTGASAADAAAGATLCWLDGEYLSFEDATLTGPSAYDLATGLWRGLFGSAPAAHLTGAAFARLDGAVFSWLLPAAYVGVDLWFKFQSFNIRGGGLEDLATCVAYPFTPAGTGFGGGAGGVPTEPTGVTATPTIGGAAIAWTAAPASDNVTGEEIWRAPGPAGAFGAAAKIGAAGAGATSYLDGTATPGTTYTYFVIFRNAIGPSTESAGEDATPTAYPGGAMTTTNEAGNFTTTSAVEGYFLDTAGGAYTVSLNAAPALNEVVEVWDATGHAGANPISFDGNGNTIAGAATAPNFIQINFGHARLIWDGTQWLM